MKKYLPLAVSLSVIILAIYLNLPTVPWFFGQNISTHLGLDLKGGVQALLEADVPSTTQITSADMDDAKSIIENRINGLVTCNTYDPGLETCVDPLLLMTVPFTVQE